MFQDSDGNVEDYGLEKYKIDLEYIENKYYNNFNRETGEYSNPELSTEQMNLIDKAIQELKYKSK